MSDTKPTVRRLYIDEADADLIRDLAEKTQESQSWLLSKIVSAGLKALADAGGKVSLPLEFSVGESKPRPKTKAA